MAIIVLGWGSLIFDHQRNEEFDFVIEGGWLRDGPILPIEFARKSKSAVDKTVTNRLTLVIDERGASLPVYWAIMEEQTLDKAREILHLREGRGLIGCIDMSRGLKIVNKNERSILSWFEQIKSDINEIDGIIWTAISSNIESPLIDNVITFIDALNDKTETELYVRRTPPEIKTPVRRVLEERYDWIPYDSK